MKIRYTVKIVAITLFMLGNNITTAYSLINLPTDMVIWSQFINKPRDKNLYSSSYLSIGYGKQIDKLSSSYERINIPKSNEDWSVDYNSLPKKSYNISLFKNDFLAYDFSYYFAFKASYLKIRIPAITYRYGSKTCEYNHCPPFGTEEPDEYDYFPGKKPYSEKITKAAINMSLGYNIIYKKNSNLGIKLVALIPMTKTKRLGIEYLCSPFLSDPYMDYDDLWGIGAGITGFYTIWEKQEAEENSLKIYLDAKAKYMSSSTICERFILPGDWTLSDKTCSHLKLRISPLLDATLMLEYTRKNWIFDIGYNFCAALGTKEYRDNQYKLGDMFYDEHKTYKEDKKRWRKCSNEISQNAFLSIGYAWKKEKRKVIPFVGLTAEILKTPEYKMAGISLKGGITF